MIIGNNRRNYEWISGFNQDDQEPRTRQKAC